MATTTRFNALADLVRDVAGSSEGVQPRDRGLVALAGTVAAALVFVVFGVAWGLVALFAGASALLLDDAVRQRLVGRGLPPVRAVAPADRSTRDRPPAGVRLGATSAEYVAPEMVRVYPTGAFGPAEGVLFRLTVENGGSRSEFAARAHPAGAGLMTAASDAAFGIAWSDTGSPLAEIRRGASRELRVAACYQHGHRRLLRFFAPSARVRRGAVGPRSYSVAVDHELPPTAGSLAFDVVVVDRNGIEVASRGFEVTWGEVALDHREARLPTIREVA